MTFVGPEKKDTGTKQQFEIKKIMDVSVFSC